MRCSEVLTDAVLPVVSRCTILVCACSSDRMGSSCALGRRLVDPSCPAGNCLYKRRQDCESHPHSISELERSMIRL